MPITSADIKLLASARMTDTTDGGGAMSGLVLQDGVENNIFPDVSTIDRAAGAMHFRKVYPANLSAGTDPLLGAHAVLDITPTDVAVSCVLAPGASAGQDLTALVVAMNAAGVSFGFRGTAHLTATLLSGATLAAVDSTYAPLIPKTVLAATVSGTAAPASDASSTVVAREDSGQTIALSIVSTGAPNSGQWGLVCGSPVGKARLKAGSVTGSFTTAEGAGSVTSDLDGRVTMTSAPGGFGVRVLHWYPAFNVFGSLDGASSTYPTVTSFAVTAAVMVDVALPKRTLRVPAVSGQTTYSIALPPGTALGSVGFQYLHQFSTPQPQGPNAITVPAADGRETWSPSGFATPNLNFASLVRATGVLTLVFQAGLPASGTLTTGANSSTWVSEIVVTYAAGGQTSPLPASSLVSSGLFTAGQANVTIGSGLVLGGATFNITGGGEVGLGILSGVVSNAGGVVRGAASNAGVLTVPGQDGRSINNWYAVQRNPQVSVSSLDVTIPASITPNTLVLTGTITGGAGFTATASAGGVFSTGGVTGTYLPSTGALQVAFAAPVDLYTIAYSADQALPQASTADLHGLLESSFPADGRVPILRTGQVAVLQHTADTAPATAVNAGTVNCGRTGLASVRVFGNNGAAIATGWTVDLATGIVTWVNVTGFSQPVRVRHAIEHVAVVSSTPSLTSARLNRAPLRDFVAGSTLSSALLMGDLQALAGAAFSQASWTDVWSNTRIGDVILPQYQQVAHPIVVTNPGAVTERWAFIFTSSTAFRFVGETLGLIATGDVNSTFAPINPATSAPYLTVAATGWGAWAAGNVLRVNTQGANAPVWPIRTTLPSVATGLDSITLALRGDINA